MRMKIFKTFPSESLGLETLGVGTVVITKDGDSTTITSGNSSAKVDITEIATTDGVIFAIDTVLTGESTPWFRCAGNIWGQKQYFICHKTKIRQS